MDREGDVVLIYYQERPAIFARIESIEPDIKKGWYHVTLLLLTIPTQPVTWILRDAYLEGSPFTMGGRPVRLEEVKKASVEGEPEELHQARGNECSRKSGTVIPFKKP